MAKHDDSMHSDAAAAWPGPAGWWAVPLFWSVAVSVAALLWWLG